MTDTDDATIEEAKKRANALHQFVGRYDDTKLIFALIDIATRRGERIKELEGGRVQCKSCGGKDTAKASGAECYNCRNKPVWERDALAEEIEKLKRLKRADFDLLSVEKRALAEEAKRLREALEALTSKCEAIISDESYKSVWTIAHIHGTKYTGPNFATEITSARDALSQRECSQRREHGL